MNEKQKTLSKPVTISGKGIHTGKKATLVLQPAAANHGLVFKRVDLDGQPIVKADVDNVVDTSRGTTLQQNGAKIHTIEHLLAALVGAGVDNCLMEIDNEELPIMDGSSIAFSEAIMKAGVTELDAEKIFFVLKENINYYDPEKNVEMTAVPGNEFQVMVTIDYKSEVLGKQFAAVESIDEFQKEVSGARTFSFLHELKPLLLAGLIKGGDLENAVVVVDRMMTKAELHELSVMFNRNDIEVNSEGILNNVKLRFSNEPARHKLLDVIGDLSLIGTPIKARIIANRPGHKTNIAFAKKIKQHIKEQKMQKQIPHYDPNQAPVFDIRMIEKNLPHAYPFLLVDKIIELGDKHVVGIKNVTFNENFFQGHFPQNPVMPGVLQLEAMAQTGGLLVLHTVTDPENWDTYFLKIDNAKFKQKVVPGDTLIMKLELTGPIRRGICEMHGVAYVGNKLVCEADLVAQIVKKQNN